MCDRTNQFKASLHTQFEPPMTTSVTPHPASGAVNPVAIVQTVQPASASTPRGYTDLADGDPHTVTFDRAARRMFRRGCLPIVGGMVLCPADVG